jgi:UDP-N-acetylmuramoyl-L-alanyl-D-glutamate--2,6-diaminopimelate ligase
MIKRILKKAKLTLEKIPGYDKMVEPYHIAQGLVASLKNGRPARDMKIIGVTGTDGKTTTTTMIYKILRTAGKNVGLITTVAQGYNEHIEPNSGHALSTPDPMILNRDIAEMRRAGVEYLVLETTSHALAQHRTLGIPFDVVVMTNVTHEHLDFHKTMEGYRNAKRRLFKLANRNRKGHRVGIINAEDKSSKLFVNDIAYPLTYGIDKGEFRAKNIKLRRDGGEYDVEWQGQKLHITTSIAGRFNVYNSLAAALVGLTYDIDPKTIEQGIKAVDYIDSRMNFIKEGQDFDFVADYAHTPGSFEALFSYYKPLSKGRIIAVFGSPGGRRDVAKRPIQGEIAGKYADIVIITEEENRETPPWEIMDQIAAGAEKAGKVRDKDLFFHEKRDDAFALAISLAKRDDTIFTLGKGNEKVLFRGEESVPWDEVGEARRLLKEYLNDKTAFRKKYMR